MLAVVFCIIVSVVDVTMSVAAVAVAVVAEVQVHY